MNMMRAEGVTLWRQIAEALRDDIHRKAFVKAGRLPPEQELAARFDVNRHTVRRAIAELETEGLVRTEHGRGTFVLDGFVNYQLGKRTRFSENIRQLNMEPSREVIQVLMEPAPTNVAKALGLKDGSPVIRLETRSRANKLIISIATHYFSARRFPGLTEIFKKENSITEALKKLGVDDYRRKKTCITARMPDVAEARQLEIPKNQPVLVAEAVNVDSNGKPLEFGISRSPANRRQYVIET
ncbi:MAG: phosphonate metabolism transcriptional regulator PhnF [Rhodospirillales bacterium]